MRFLFSILVSVLLAYTFGFYLTVPANPEVKFWREVMERRDAEISEVRASQPGTPIIFFTGGSGSAFSIDPGIIEQSCKLPTFNLGLPIAAGGHYILHQAFKRTRPGDILVVCLESDVLANGGEADASALSFSLSMVDKDPLGAAGGDTFGKGLEFQEILNLPRPGASYLATLGARLITGRNYRYTVADIRYRGRIETQQNNPAMLPLGQPVSLHLHPDGALLLKTLANAAKLRGVTLFYSMPWRWTMAEHADAWRSKNLDFLEEIGAIIPVLDDGTRGVSSDRENFSDSLQHLTAAGSRDISKTLAPTLEAALPHR